MNNNVLRLIPQYLNNPENKYFYTYILLCDDKTFYCGITKDFYNRLKEHKTKQSKYTSRFKKIDLIGVMVFSSRLEARKMEKLIKQFGVKRYATDINLDLINGLHDKSNIIYWHRLPILVK